MQRSDLILDFSLKWNYLNRKPVFLVIRINFYSNIFISDYTQFSVSWVNLSIVVWIIHIQLHWWTLCDYMWIFKKDVIIRRQRGRWHHNWTCYATIFLIKISLITLTSSHFVIFLRTSLLFNFISHSIVRMIEE